MSEKRARQTAFVFTDELPPESPREDHQQDAEAVEGCVEAAYQGFPEPEGAIFDSEAYYPKTLNYWHVVLNPFRTIWSSSSLWRAYRKVLVLVLLTASMTFFFSHRPQAWRPRRFLQICKFLAFFVGFILGLFIARALGRWYRCTNGFLELCDAIRNLNMQLCALGASDDMLDRCARYGLVSATLLHFQLLTEGLSPKEAKEKKQKLWESLRTSETGNLGRAIKLDDVEFFTMQRLRDPSGVMWMWVTSLIARMAQDGEIPPMQSATYGRVVELAKAAHSGIRVVRASISIQTPFLVSHALASLVHINNILNAICLGLVIGCVMGESAMYYHIHPIYKGTVTEGEMVRDMQVIGISSFVNLIGPLLFQALFEISLAIAQPFQSQLACLPIGMLTESVVQELEDQVKMSKTTPHWKKPSYIGDGAV